MDYTEKIEKITIPLSKRIFDICASSLVIIVLSPVMLVFFVFMMVEYLVSSRSRGPILYREIRMSQDEPFVFYKIRTFKNQAIENVRREGVVIHTKSLEHDFRNLTVVGMALVQTYLDEFPQLFLVLFGRMTFVGPRPTNKDVYERYVAGGGVAKRVLKAGLTGRFQTHKAIKYGLDQEKEDIAYADFVRSHSGMRIVLKDLWILMQTVLTIFRAEGI